ncbi:MULTISPECIES: sterol desaturase family protein [Marivita]|uniref:Sterol desaturase family protein n=1 Tax=Marivita cryptomonadis TaxID=505252 RepID=A0A9Q2NUS4_9RHOB|nr:MULTISPECIES: sterol desaturase family protein [Marivita]MCR9170115.1 sterol desaturase family protein [Paracoccaceae bacterium]MBM2323254.1 sterol desaturase family protein [Marivita cryptomonadis]MBM2332839.1 sterol desaturase family protein [Marivita cryptomonadis]MBM2342420.1 sterol desaturase family protein [Marivita cryptomonadis]MBM2347088.1 sterol desaturase family protein [Marivita cryptomonadis]
MSIDSLVALFDLHQIMWIVATLFVINMTITGIEVVLDLTTHKERRWQDTAANCAIFVAHQVIEKTALASLGFVALLPFYYLTPLTIPMTAWTWLLAVLAADFTYYWMHRIEHEHRILWASHSVHHSSEDYNLTVGFRLSVVEGFFEWAFLIPMILIGFNPFQAIVGLVLVAQYQHWVHTERVTKLGWLDEVFNTPSVHRVHHGSNRQYLDKNYGGILMIWDKLFGTFEREDEKVVYGLTRNIHTNNPIKITFVEFGNIWQDVKKCRTMKDKLRIIFGGLSWRPEYFRTAKQDADLDNSAMKND